MKKFYFILSLLITLNFSASFTQNKFDDTLFIATWNVENLFDTVDDPKKNDNEFLPESPKNWTEDRLDQKLYNLAKVIHSMNNGRGPDILGICEVEHESLLHSMISKYLSDLNYKIAYSESPDERGIDNGLIYNSNKFTLAGVIPDSVKLKDGDYTRLILNVNLISKVTGDTFHVFVNHWPSRIGGVQKSEPNRIKAASILSGKVKAYLSSNNESDIIIIGDFNDEPSNKSVSEIVDAQLFECSKKIGNENVLFNLSYQSFNQGEGSYKYRNNWDMLDQIIVSGNLVNGKIKYICNSFTVYKPYFLLTHSGKYQGAPFPTYGGKRYLGGYSDHFPVIAKFIISKN